MVHANHGINISPAPVPAVPKVITRADGEMDEADRALAAMGYTPVFKREFSMWSCFSFALSISGLYATIITTFIYPLYAGGAASVVWCWLIGGGGALALALSIAEISSSYPTSGAMYFTLKYLCPQEYLPVVAWLDGWLNLIGTITGTASSQYGAAQMLLSAVSIGTGFSYQPTQGHITGVMAALCMIHALVNSLSTAWLNKISSTYAVFHIGVLIAAAAALLALQREKHDAAYVFTNLEPLSGWTPPGFSFFFGCLSAAWIMTNCDGVGHIAEETKDPSRVVPIAITSASVFTYVAGFLYNIVLAYCMGDPGELLASPTGLPVSQIFYNVMGTGPAVFFTITAFIVMNFVCIPSVHAGSRTLWAFSRDEMVPLSRYWYRIYKRSDTPVYSVWLYASLCVLINLIGLGSPILIAAVFNVCAIALNWSYCIPIICKLMYGKFERGPWHLGRFSVAINLFAVGWNAFLSVLFLLPTLRPVTPENMNYASVVLAFVIAFSVGHWLIRGRKYYVGPRTHAHIANGEAVSDESPPDQEKDMP
ncbi:polyamine transporter tpo5 [Madurella fahalii]|uniref:Polyamine transporter tpo5 n=1 Tax=Madurella fahalii TaxID=1157608 RepID=A0ABQ0GGJ7_9PEZI